MIDHLSSEQISRFIAGDGSSDEAQHARDCKRCAAEVERLNEIFSVFHDSAQQWGERMSGAPAWTKQRGFRTPALGWAIAALLVVLAAIPIYRTMSERPRGGDVEDALLLEQINAHLSRS